MSNPLDGNYRIERPAFDRQLAMESFAALPEAHPMVALLELDVTVAQQRIAAQRQCGVRTSLFAFVVRAIAVALAEHPELRVMRHGRKFVCFEDVDVSIPVEIQVADGHAPRELVVRRAQDCSVEDIYEQLVQARQRQLQVGELGPEDRWSRRMLATLLWMPRFVRLFAMRRVIANAFMVKRRAGTTLVTSVGKFADIPGFGFALMMGPRATTFAVGSVVKKPWVHEGQIAVRSVLGLAVLVNHDLTDGGPAARFARRLQALLESADGLPAPATPA